jgi:serine/threonine protein kinase
MDPDPLVGRNQSHCRVVERLGGVGMGVVYETVDLKLRRHVALKYLPEELVQDSAIRGRFQQEAEYATLQ